MSKWSFSQVLVIMIVPSSQHSYIPPLALPPNITCTLYPACQHFILGSLFDNNLRAIAANWDIFIPTVLIVGATVNVLGTCGVIQQAPISDPNQKMSKTL